MRVGPEGWRELSAQRITVPANVVYRTFAQETVLLNIKTGEYHGVDPIGARFLEVMQEAPHLAAASEILANEYEQPLTRIEDDLVAFTRDMERRGLIELQPLTS
jgi:hypothetical protein